MTIKEFSTNSYVKTVLIKLKITVCTFKLCTVFTFPGIRGDREWKGGICLNGWKIKIIVVFPKLLGLIWLWEETGKFANLIKINFN